MKLFDKNIIGLDISDTDLEIVELEKVEKDILVKNKERVKLDEGVVVNGKVNDSEKLLQSLNKLFENKEGEIGRKHVIFGIPEQLVYLNVIELDKGKDIERRIKEKIARFVPVEQQNLAINYDILAEKDGKIKIFVATVDNAELSKWNEVLKQTKVKIDAYDLESQALYRGLFNEGSREKVIVIDTSENNVYVSYFNEGGLIHSQIIYIDKDSIEKKIGDIREEIESTLDYYSSKLNYSPEKIVVVGTKKVFNKIQSKLEIGELSVEHGESRVGDLGRAYTYIEAAGLAKKGFLNIEFKAENIDMDVSEDESEPLEELEEEDAEGAEYEEDIERSEDKEGSKSKTIEIVVLLALLLVIAGFVYFIFFYDKSPSEEGEVLGVTKSLV